MKVRVTVGTTYCGCPSESFIIECDSEKDFEENDAYSTEILNEILNLSHYFVDYEYLDDDYSEEDEDDWEESEEEED